MNNLEFHHQQFQRHESDRELLDALGGMLLEANLRLRQAGIAGVPPLPRGVDGITREIVRDRDESAPRRGDQRAFGVSGSGSMHPTEAVDDVFVAVRELVGAFMAAQRDATRQEPSPWTSLDSQGALNALRSLQRETPDSLLRAVDDPQLSLGDVLQQELLGQAQRQGIAASGATLAESDEEAVLLVGMLFDVLLCQRSYQRPVREQFVRLSVAYARAAMLDQQLFALKSHPARRLLNALAEACDGNQGESSAERDMLYRVGFVVERLATEFQDDIAIFAEVEVEFREFMAQHRRRVELAERRAAETQRGCERLDEARILASMDLACLMGARESPPAIDGFLTRYWTHHLAVVSLRDSVQSAAYVEAKRAGEALWRAFLDCENGADRPQDLHARLLPVLASSGVCGQLAGDVLAAIDHVLDAVRLGRRDAALMHRLPSAEIFVPRAEVAPEPAIMEVDAGTEAVVAPCLHVVGETDAPDFDPAMVDRIRALELGAWVEFFDAEGTTVPAKLSWISPISSRLLFVNRRGMRHCAASAQELAAMVRRGKLVLRSADTAVERAMNQVLGRMREAAHGRLATSHLPG